MSEIDELYKRNAELIKECLELNAENARLQKVVDEAEGVIDDIEFYGGYCFYCNNSEETGHSEICNINKYFKEYGGKE